MRLTKQLKAQANSIKFASQLPTTTDFILNHNLINKDIVNNTERSTLVTSSNTEENDQPLISNRKITFEDSSNNSNHNNQRKIPTIITTSHSDGCLNNEKQRLAIRRYNFDDDDSLNSNFLHDEQIML